jgi:molybdopterin-guanine dinucleotide biosynthesis protein A
MNTSIPIVIFAGGKSSRMGKDKALLPFGGAQTLIAYQYRRLSPYFSTLYLSAKESKSDTQISLIPDLYKEYSPLTGLVSLFESLDAEKLFILSVDAPFIDHTIIQTILDTQGEYDAVIARNNGEVQPLCGCYSRTVLPKAKAMLQHGEHRLKSLLTQVNTHYVDFHEAVSFMNLNRPEEYEEACRLITFGE